MSGLTRRQILATVITEALGATLIGLLLGALAAALSLVGLWIATFHTYGTPVIAIPWGLLASLTIIGAVVTAATAVVTAARTMRDSPVTQLGTRE